MTGLKHNALTAKKGFSLLIALVFVAFFGSVLTSFVYSRSGESLRNEAEITGWQVAKIARAARVFVRDQLSANPNLKFDLAASGPQLIDVDDLTNASLLPHDFAREDGGSFFTALDQEIRVIMANYPVGADPAALSTVPTAYVYLVASDRAGQSLIQDIVQAARRQDVAIAAPLFDEFNNNLSGTCDGLGDSVVIWDTGCLADVEFATLTGEDFVPGSLMVPAWRSVNFDSRILMRFPQPEGTGASTMLTELEMGDPLADCETNEDSRITVPSDDAGETELCGAISDNIAEADGQLADRRRDMLNIGNLEGGTYVAYRQSGNDVTHDSITGFRTNAAADEVNALDLDGDLTATGDMKVFEGNTDVAGTVTVDRNVLVPTNAGNTVTASVGRLSGNAMTASTLDVTALVTTGAPISANEIIATPTAIIDGTLVTEQMQMNTGGATITSTGGADMLGRTDASSVALSGAGEYSYISGSISTQSVNVTGNVAAGNSAALSTVSAGRVDTAECRGDCPERIADDIDDGVLDDDDIGDGF